MKYLKYYESIGGIREVNIKKLWDDYKKFKNKLKIDDSEFNVLKKSNIDTWSVDAIVAGRFVDTVITPIILNKKIEFNRVKNRFTDDITNNFKGMVKDIFIEIRNNDSFNIIVETNTNRLYLIKMNLNDSQDKSHKIEDTILIHDSEKSAIENEIDILNSTEKFNL